MLALLALLALALSTALGDLRGQLTTHSITLPATLKPGDTNWRVWGYSPLTSRLYLSPTSTGYLLGWTDSTLKGHVTVISSDYKVVKTIDFSREVRGLVGHTDGSFAVLLWSDADDAISVRKMSSSGSQVWDTALVNSDGAKPTDFGIGESRLTYGKVSGKGRYGAYYHVHSTSGHEGDALKWVDEATGAATNEWNWGCSHSMSELLGYNPSASVFVPVCVTDCYPGTGSGDFSAVSQGGIFSWHDENKRIYTLDGGCDGSVAGELGGMAATPSTGFKMVFNGHSNAAGLGQSSYNKDTMNQDIGFVSISSDGSLSGSVKWLTSTSENEANSGIARYGGITQELYLAGWQSGSKYMLAELDGSGTFKSGPVDVSDLAKWGDRDDPFKTAADGSIVWAYSPTQAKDIVIATVVSSTCACTSGGCCDGCRFRSSGYVCRPSVDSGLCDPQETCTGSSNECPSDTRRGSETVCRSSTGVCDIAETCTASGCPADAHKAAGSSCDDGQACTVGDVCTAAGVCAGKGSCSSTSPKSDSKKSASRSSTESPASETDSYIRGSAASICLPVAASLFLFSVCI